MQQQLKATRTEGKGKSASKVATASDKLQYLMDFNTSISKAMAKTMEHLSDFVIVSMANLTLITHEIWNEAGYISSSENCSPATYHPLPGQCA